MLVMYDDEKLSMVSGERTVEYRNRLTASIMEASLSSQVKLLRSREDMPELLAAPDVYLCLRFSELMRVLEACRVAFLYLHPILTRFALRLPVYESYQREVSTA
jgi:hypothetical protein